MRTVEITAAERPIPRIAGLTQEKVQAAIGYLVMWGYHPETYDNPSWVGIHLCHDGEITALYKKTKEQEKGMLMVAVWRHAEQEYTFHT